MYEPDGVSFSIGEHVLLHPLALAPAKGRVCGLIGHNGTGQSTLLELLARQQSPLTWSPRQP